MKGYLKFAAAFVGVWFLLMLICIGSFVTIAYCIKLFMAWG